MPNVAPSDFFEWTIVASGADATATPPTATVPIDLTIDPVTGARKGPACRFQLPDGGGATVTTASGGARQVTDLPDDHVPIEVQATAIDDVNANDRVRAWWP